MSPEDCIIEELEARIQDVIDAYRSGTPLTEEQVQELESLVAPTQYEF